MNISNYLETADKKIHNKPIKTFILAVYAGIFISLAAILSTIVSFQIDNYSIAKILSGLVFPIGLILVILFKTELFTGNSLLIISLIEKKASLKQVLKNWLIVYLGNLSGALLISLLIITPITAYHFLVEWNNILSTIFITSPTIIYDLFSFLVIFVDI